MLKKLLVFGGIAVLCCSLFAEEKTFLTTKNGKPFAAVIDIMPQLCLGSYDIQLVEKNIALLAELGFKRLYFVVVNPGYPCFSNPAPGK